MLSDSRWDESARAYKNWHGHSETIHVNQLANAGLDIRGLAGTLSFGRAVETVVVQKESWPSDACLDPGSRDCALQV